MRKPLIEACFDVYSVPVRPVPVRPIPEELIDDLFEVILKHSKKIQNEDARHPARP